jgi:branched-chain amino acid transport system substrate-binding protein
LAGGTVGTIADRGPGNAGGDTINSIKQAAEFGIVKRGQSLAALLATSVDVAALGLPLAQ